MKRVILIDDDPAVRHGVSALLVAGGYIVDIYESAEDFLSDLDAFKSEPGVILLDIYMSKMDGLTLLKTLVDQKFPLPVIIMTAHGDVPLAVKAMREGAADFIEKPFTGDVLMTALERAADKIALVRASPPQQCKDASNEKGKITSREREVLKLLYDGLSNKEIAIQLDISPRTVEVHRQHIMSKLNVDSFAHLIRIAGSLDL